MTRHLLAVRGFFHWKRCNYVVHLGEFKIHGPFKRYLFRSGYQYDKEHKNISWRMAAFKDLFIKQAGLAII